MRYSIEPRTIKYVKRYGFLLFKWKYRKQLLDTRLDALKTASKKIVHKAAEETCNFIGNKIPGRIVKPKHVINENPRNVEKIIIQQQKREQLLNQLG